MPVNHRKGGVACIPVIHSNGGVACLPVNHSKGGGVAGLTIGAAEEGVACVSINLSGGDVPVPGRPHACVTFCLSLLVLLS